MIRFVDIVKSFGPKSVLEGVSFDVRPGEVFFIIGASGVGKSVLIKHLVGLMAPDDGEVWLDGEEISRFDEARMFPVRMKCAMVFQHSTLFDSMTCAENVALPLRKHRGYSLADSLGEAKKRLGAVQMGPFADAYPAALGDGMKKRVAIARALTLDPKYVLFDEPTTSLDPVSARPRRRTDSAALRRERRHLDRRQPRSRQHLRHRRPDRHAVPRSRPLPRHAGGVQGHARRGRPAIHPRARGRADGAVTGRALE